MTFLCLVLVGSLQAEAVAPATGAGRVRDHGLAAQPRHSQPVVGRIDTAAAASPLEFETNRLLSDALFPLRPQAGALKRPLRTTSKVPPGLTPHDWSGIQRQVNESAYRIVPAEATPSGPKQARLVARNRRQGFETTFTSDGLLLAGHQSESWSVPLRLSGFGCGATPPPVAVVHPVLAGDRVEYRRPRLVEWYVNRPSGLEQGFTLIQAPGDCEGDAEVRLEMTLGSGLMARAGSSGVVLRDTATGAEVLYDGLVVTDATGLILPARFQTEETRVVVAIDVRQAVWPVTVDPTFTLYQVLQRNDDSGGDFGHSVAVSGDTAIVGAWTEGDFIEGAAYVFVRLGSTWVLQQKLVPSESQMNGYFGYSVAVSGDTAIIGAHPTDQNYPNQGAAYVFVRSGVTWTEQQKLLASDGGTGDLFGYSVSISGDTAIIGAEWHDQKRGAAYVFTRSAAAWTEQQKLVAPNAAAGDWFGAAVTVSGDTAVVGAYRKDAFRGSAYVFARSGSTWTQQQTLTASDGAADYDFGAAVAISGETVVVGADQYGAITPSGPGAAYVFTRSGAAWVQQAKLVASDGTIGDCFGISVAVLGDLVLAGSPCQAGFNGAAYVFIRSGTTWTQHQKVPAAENYLGSGVALSTDTLLVGVPGGNGVVLAFSAPEPPPSIQQQVLTASDGMDLDAFGVAVSMSGDTVIGGAPESNTGRGAAYVYVRDGSTWTQQAKLVASDGMSGDSVNVLGDRFGTAVSLSGDTALVGAPEKNSRRGAVYVFERAGSVWTEKQKLLAPDGLPLDNFGWSVSVFGDTAFVGAYRANSNRGRVYVFARSSGVWTLTKTVYPSDALGGNAYFGYSVSVAGNTALVGAWGANAVSVLELSGSYGWTLSQDLFGPAGAVYFGRGVSLSADTAVITAPGSDSWRGSVYVYTRSGGNFSLQQRLDGAAPGERFGDAVSVSGHTIGVGAPWSGDTAGAAYVFVRSGSTWTLAKKLVAADAAPDNVFGNSVALFGSAGVVGAAGKASRRGAVYAFEAKCLAEGSGDGDGDGIPNNVEAMEGRDACSKDNDVFNNARLFAMQQYRDFLKREGESTGIAYWTAQIQGGTARASVTKQFFDSPEFQGAIAPVARLYFAYFNRIPDKPGLDYWIAQYRAGTSLHTISQAFAGSPEFQATYGSLSNAQFVTLVYQNVLGRAPDAFGFTYWTSRLDGGLETRGQVMVGFSESPEYQRTSYARVFVTMTYYGMLRRMPEQSGFDYWVWQISLGASNLDLLNGFLAAPEYRGRFMP